MNSIYALVHPVTSEVRYVGKTVNVKNRHTSHCYTKSKTHVSHWVQHLRKSGLYPTMIVLESDLSEDAWPEAEQFWIEYLSGMGANLTNITKGGHDVVNRCPHPNGYTLGYKVPALFKNEMCWVVNTAKGPIYMFMQLTERQAGWVRENERRCNVHRRFPRMKIKDIIARAEVEQ